VVSFSLNIGRYRASVGSTDARKMRARRLGVVGPTRAR
jgi:hypothetical protein